MMAIARIHIKRFIAALLLAVSGTTVVSAWNDTSADAAAVSRCTANNLTARIDGVNGAATQFYFYIAFTNEGSTPCELTSLPQAQPVVGPKRTPVGPASQFRQTNYAIPTFVVLHARFGQVDVLYTVINKVDWPTSKCSPALANGVLVRASRVGSFYVSITRPGATEVCTKLADTWIGLFYPPSLVQVRQSAYKFATTELQDYLNAWRNHGPVIASREFLVPNQRGGGVIINGKQRNIYLANGTARFDRLWSWASPDEFTLLMTLDLHFKGWPAAWTIGKNDRFATYTWSSKSAHYEMELNTGP